MATALLFPEKITRDSDMSLESREISAKFGDKYSQHAPDGLNAVFETWAITWAPLTQAQKLSLIALIRSVGTWGIVTWTPADEASQLKFRFTGPVTFGRVNKTLYKVSANLEQVFDV